MVTQNPYPIYGTVTVSVAGTTSTIEGATIWIKDRTEGTVRTSFGGGTKENIYITRTNSSGQYILDLADLTSSYSDGDTVRVFNEIQGRKSYEDVTIDTQVGMSNQDFSLTRRSGLKDGMDKVVTASDRTAGLESLGTGMRPGLKDGMV